MRRSSLAIASCLLLAAAVPSGAATDGPDGIHRCEADDGNSVYTDKTCGTFSAHPTPLSHELVTRIVMSDVPPPAGTIENNYPIDDFAYPEASQTIPERSYGRRPLTDGCARTPQQLSQDLAGSFALHDVNRVAESYHWVGMTQHQSLPVMKQLERLSAQPLEDARFLAAWISSQELAPSAIANDAGLMQLVFAGDGVHEVDFRVRRYAGCYFISA
jgi:hypothetical protein